MNTFDDRLLKGGMKGMRQAQEGLTLIETMMLLAVIGILVTIAIPPAYEAYKDYQAREQVNEALDLLNNAKSRVTQFHTSHHRWPTKAEFEGLIHDQAGKYVASLTAQALDKGFQLTATFRTNGVSPELLHEGTGRKLVLATIDGVKWICNDSADPATGVPGIDPGDVLSKHRPAACV